MKKMLVLLLLMVFCLSFARAEDAPGSWLSSVLGDELSRELRVKKTEETVRPEKGQGYVALLYIEGEILENAYQYDHVGTLNAIDDLMEDYRNTALMLYLNTPGGSLYEADELYHKLMTYKKETGRPVYAYMAQECCSAGVYIAMAADRIAASRMTLTGSVGVYMTTYSQSGLLQKLGIENEYIASGENKVPGYPELTQEQREIYRSVVDEGFECFKEAIAAARGLNETQMAGFLDGRVLTAKQAKTAGLIDDVLYYDEFADYVSGQHDGVQIKDKTPDDSFGAAGTDMLKWLLELMPKGASEGKNTFEHVQKGGLKS